MSTSTRADLAPTQPGSTAPPAAATGRAVKDVVAGLFNDGSAYAVALAAAREAERRGSRVKFIQVVPPGLSVEDRRDVDRATFQAALRALRGRHRVACSFEVIDGEAGSALVEHSSGAALLVVGRHSTSADHNVSRHCLEHASCDVLTVSVD